MATVSIIMRTKNRPLFLPRAIGSVCSQTYRDWHLTIVNDGGDKREVEREVTKFRRALGGRFTLIHNKVSRGMEAASNLGIRESSGELLTLHDDDDSWHPQFLKEGVKLLSRRSLPTWGGVVSHWEWIFESVKSGRIREQKRTRSSPTHLDVCLFRIATRNRNFPPISFLYRRCVLERIGGYREDLPVLGDWDFNLRFLRHTNIAVCPKPLAYYHLRNAKRKSESMFANTMFASAEDHELCATLLRNELLRRDLDKGVFDLGAIVNIAGELDNLIHSNEQMLASLTRGKTLFATLANSFLYQAPRLQPHRVVAGVARRIARILGREQKREPQIA